MTQNHDMSAEQYLALETIARAIVARNLPDLRIGIQDRDLSILALAAENLQADIEVFPRERLDFLATELMMILAANTVGDLHVGMGDLFDE